MLDCPVNLSINEFTRKEGESLEDYEVRVENLYTKNLSQLEDKFDSANKEAIKKRSGLSPDQIRAIRRKAKTDLFFLCYSILGYDRLSPRLHGNLCAWLDINRTEKYTEVLLPRAHFKSTIETIGRTIQIILPDDVGDQPYPFNLGPDARVLICHEVAGMASGYLYSITQQFMSNPLLMALFPECVPVPKKQRINSRQLDLPRKHIWNEPTVGIIGVGGRSQGLHYDDICFDDIIGEAARDSETEMNSTKQWVDNIQSFFVRLATGRLRVVGTRYAPDDVYSHIEERYGDVGLKIYRRAVEEPDYNDIDPVTKKPKLKTIFPEEIDEKALIVLKKNPIVFAAQYMNDPEGGNTKFDPSWIKLFNWQLDNTAISLFNAPIHKQRLVHVADLGKVLLWDPALSGNTGWCMVGTDYYDRHFVLEAVQEQISAPAAVQKWFDLYAKYKFYALVIEEVLFSELYRHWLETEFKVRGVSFTIIPAKTEGKEKGARVLGLSPFLSAGQIYFNEQFYSRTQDKTGKYSDMLYQIIKFGAIREYHILDSLAYLPANAVRGINPELARANQRAELEKVSNRNAHTGYSKINYRKG